MFDWFRAWFGRGGERGAIRWRKRARFAGVHALGFGHANAMKPTRHCYRCGWEWAIPGQPGRNDLCQQCSADLRCCLNCVSYDPKAAEQCRDRRADLVHDKQLANFCEYFDMARRVFVPRSEANPREEAARNSLKKLLGD